MARSRPLVPFLVPVLGLLLVGGLAAPAGATDLATAAADLERFEKEMKSRKTTNDDLLASINALSQAYQTLAPADGAPPAELKAIEKFKSDVEKALLKAVALEKLEGNEDNATNIRMDVNIAAARAVAATGNAELAKDLQGVLEKRIFNAKYNVAALVFDEVFLALAKLNDHDVLAWMLDQFTHTKASPAIEVDKLVAAHKAMVAFTNVPGKLRIEIVKQMSKIYAPVERSASTQSTDPKVQSAKQFWDKVKIGAIRVAQYFALEPKNADGVALATMVEFEDWFRDNDNPRKAPWTDPEPANGGGN
jgi:hypothetical protein